MILSTITGTRDFRFNRSYLRMGLYYFFLTFSTVVCSGMETFTDTNRGHNQSPLNPIMCHKPLAIRDLISVLTTIVRWTLNSHTRNIKLPENLELISLFPQVQLSNIYVGAAFQYAIYQLNNVSYSFNAFRDIFGGKPPHFRKKNSPR